MFFNIYFEEFKKNFKPSFREELDKTYCIYENEEILYRDESSSQYIWLKEYSQEVKNFIIGQIQGYLTPKFLLADYYINDNKVITLSGQELNQFVVPKSTYLDLLILMNKEIIPVQAVRVLGEGYKIRPRLKLKANGFDYLYQQKLALGVMMKLIPGVIESSVLEKWGYQKPQVSEETKLKILNILNQENPQKQIVIKSAVENDKHIVVEYSVDGETKTTNLIFN